MCVQMSVECTSDSNVSEWNYGWKPFFIYIDSYIVCLFVFCFVIDFCGVAATTFYIFCTLFVHHFPVEGKQFMQQYSKTHLQSLSQTLQCQK